MTSYNKTLQVSLFSCLNFWFLAINYVDSRLEEPLKLIQNLTKPFLNSRIVGT